MINFLENTTNQRFEFVTKNCVEINDDARGTYNTNSYFAFKTAILNSVLYGFLWRQ